MALGRAALVAALVMCLIWTIIWFSPVGLGMSVLIAIGLICTLFVGPPSDRT